ncbi:MAG TPA: hypothetical protein IAB66_09875 [Candidatus Caccousia avistercoris]|nr:hypothetical protein [Candidatus Caccousia avistercoris]
MALFKAETLLLLLSRLYPRRREKSAALPARKPPEQDGQGNARQIVVLDY